MCSEGGSPNGVCSILAAGMWGSLLDSPTRSSVHPWHREASPSGHKKREAEKLAEAAVARAGGRARWLHALPRKRTPPSSAESRA